MIGIVVAVLGAVFLVAGIVTYAIVSSTLAAEQITVSDDARHFAGDDVNGPFTAYFQADIIATHAEGIADGKTYAELPQDDPRRAAGDGCVVPARQPVHVGGRVRGRRLRRRDGRAPDRDRHRPGPARTPGLNADPSLTYDGSAWWSGEGGRERDRGAGQRLAHGAVGLGALGGLDELLLG